MLRHPVLRIPFRPFYRATIRPVEADPIAEPVEEIMDIVESTPPWRMTSDERLEVARETDPSLRWMDIVPIHRGEVLGAIKRGEDVPENIKQEHGI